MWVTQNPWPPIALCAGIAVLLAGGFVTTKRPRYLVGVFVAIAAALAIFVVERSIVTETERVESAVHAVIDAFQRDDEPATLAHVSPAAAEERAKIVRAFQLIEVDADLRTFDLAIDWNADRTTAISDFRANGTVRLRTGGLSTHVASRWRLTWGRDGDTWKITRIERLDPVSGDVMNDFDR